jgi:hypothetical protein
MLFLLGHFGPQEFGNQLCSDMTSYPRRTNVSKPLFLHLQAAKGKRGTEGKTST